MFTRLVSMLRDPSMSLDGVNDSFKVDIVSPCALTYEVFGRMARSAVQKVQTRDIGAVNGVRILQSMLHTMHDELRDFLCGECLLEEKQAFILIERAVFEAKIKVDGVLQTLDGTALVSPDNLQQSKLAMQGEIDGVVVSALPAVVRIVLWMVYAVTNHQEIAWDDEQSIRVREDLRGLAVSLEISKTSLKSMIDMNEQLVAGFTRQMMLSEMQQRGREEVQGRMTTEVTVLRGALQNAKGLLSMNTFMVTDTEGSILEWGKVARDVTGIEQITERHNEMLHSFFQEELIQKTMSVVKAGGTKDVDMAPMHVLLHTFENGMAQRGEKAFLSLKAAAYQDGQEGCVRKIMWLGDDLTASYKEMVSKQGEVDAANKQIADMKTEIAGLHATVSQQCVEKKDACEEVARVHEENKSLKQKVLETTAENEKLMTELGKFRQFMSGIDALTKNLSDA